MAARHAGRNRDAARTVRPPASDHPAGDHRANGDYDDGEGASRDPGLGWFTRLDAGVLVLLLVLTGLGWCAAHGTWSSDQWSRPTAYLDPVKADVVHALAMMKAGSEGQFWPLAWKQVRELGAPDGANWNDWPMVEELQILFLAGLARLFGLFAGLNVGMLLAQLLAAATFYLVARSVGCLPPWALVAGLAYGLAPFIFAQSPFHITTVFVWHVPLFLPIWRWVATEPGIVWGSRRFWYAVAVGFITGLQSPYFTNILCQLTLLGAAVLFLRRRATGGADAAAPLRSALAVILAAAAAFVLMNLDSWSYRLVHGPNPGALVREYKWLEIYGLKLVDLVVPPVVHRLPPLASFATAHRATAPLQDEGSYLGLVGIAALVLLAGTAIAHVIRRRADAVPMEAWQVLWIVLAFTTGGLNAILGAFGFTIFRTGCRYSVVILAIVLLSAAQWLSAWQRRAAATWSSDTLRIAVLTAAAGLCGLVLVDQVPRGPTAEEAGLIARQVESDRVFTAAMEEALPSGAAVFQLPVMEFPESPLPGIPSYDHFRPYLYSRGLRYSFGTMKGRQRDRWQQEVQQQLLEGAAVDQQAQKIRFSVGNVNRAVKALEERGFQAIYLNRNAFPDRGRGLEEALAELGFDASPINAPAGDLVCIKLTKD